MKELFGIPMDTLAAVLAVLVAIVAGSLGVLALRHRVLLKLGVRNLGRRRARSALIVVGLMLGTTIIAAALATGDTMSHTIRATATRQFGETEEIVAAKGAADDIAGELGSRDGHRLLPAEHGREGPARPRRASTSPTASRARSSRTSRSRPRSSARPSRASRSTRRIRRAWARSRRSAACGGGTVTLDELRRGEAYLNKKAADALHVRAGDPMLVYVGAKPVRMRIRDVVRFNGAMTADTALLLPLREAQRLYGKPGLVKGIASRTEAAVTRPSRARTRSSAH